MNFIRIASILYGLVGINLNIIINFVTHQTEIGRCLFIGKITGGGWLLQFCYHAVPTFFFC